MVMGLRVLKNRSHLILLTVLCVLAQGMYAQDVAQIDATIQFYPNQFNDVSKLSQLISRDFTTEEEKVRAIYGWIINNVAYEPSEYEVFNYSFKDYRERNSKEENTRNKTIQRTLQKGIAVCEGYAMLFEKLCELQGIQNYLVRGDIKTSFDDIGREFKRVHMWNVVYIEGRPYLIDATWGAGKYNGGFIKEPSYDWYKTDPAIFVKSHYPDLVEDALLDFQFSRELFSRLPLIIHKSLRIEDVKRPAEGVITSDTNVENITFLIKMELPASISYAFDFGKREKVTNVKKDDAFLEFQIKSKAHSNLVVYFDDVPALGYKVE